MGAEPAAVSAVAGDATRDLTPERANARLIASRLPVLAALWLGHDALWGVLRIVNGMAGPSVYGIHLLVAALGFGVAIVLVRRDPAAPSVRWIAMGVCLVVATTVAVTEARMHGFGEIVRGSHSFLCLLASLLFAWGWAPAAVLVAGSSVAFVLVQAELRFFLPAQDLWVAYGTASLIAVALAESAARWFRTVWFRREAERSVLAELEASRNAYRDLAENARDHIWLLDLEGHIVYANAAVARYLGVSGNDVIGVSVFALITDHPQNPDVRALIPRLVEGEVLPPLLFQVAPRPGHPDVRWHEVVVSGVHGPDGTVTGIRGVSRDVHERVEAQEQLRASEERFRGAFAASSVGLTITDCAGRGIQLNDAICTMLGRSREELMTMTIDDVTHPDDRAITHRERQRLLDGETPSFTLEKRFLRPDGEIVWGMLNVSALRDAQGVPFAFIALVQDITERRQADDAVREHRGKLQRLARQQTAIREEERKRLGLDLHDDVCQELVGMSIMVESMRLRMERVSRDDATDLARIGRVVTSLSEHLRLLAHEMRPVHLGDLGLAGSLRSLGNGLSTEQCRIIVGFPTRVPRFDEETEVGVYRIAQEALSNAMRHAEAPRIELALAVRNEMLELEVRDTGRGFRPSDSSEGLGLFSMEERALALGGRLQVQSAPGQGTVVRLTCPLRDDRAA